MFESPYQSALAHDPPDTVAVQMPLGFVEKYGKHSPLNRQVERYTRQGGRRGRCTGFSGTMDGYVSRDIG
jgi:hypothetical protein